MREIVIGDIHGCYEELQELLQKIDLRAEDRIVALGDIVDRGPDSVKVYDFLRQRPNTIVLMGNHERKHLRGQLSYAQEIVKLQFGERYAEFLDWLQPLPYQYESVNARIVHAFYEADLPWEEQQDFVLSGTSSGDRYLKEKYGEKSHWYEHYPEEAKAIIVGHHVVGHDILQHRPNVYGIDTGACHGWRLSALCLPDFKVYQIDAKMDYWKSAMDKWQMPVLLSKDWASMDFELMLQQIQKLSYKTGADVQEFLQELEDYIEHIRKIFHTLKAAIIAEAKAMETENFHEEAGSKKHKNFLYAALHDRLEIGSLQRRFSSPRKLKEILDYYGLSVPAPWE